MNDDDGKIGTLSLRKEFEKVTIEWGLDMVALGDILEGLQLLMEAGDSPEPCTLGSLARQVRARSKEILNFSEEFWFKLPDESKPMVESK